MKDNTFFDDLVTSLQEAIELSKALPKVNKDKEAELDKYFASREPKTKKIIYKRKKHNEL